MILLKHKGLCGCDIKVVGSKVHKWTSGKESESKLLVSHLKSVAAKKSKSSRPFIPVTGEIVLGDGTTLVMDLIEGESGFTTNDIPLLDELIIKYFDRDWPLVTGFRSKIAERLKDFPDSDLRRDIYSRIDRIRDSYPAGFCHGDFGFANMILNGKYYLIDYTEVFMNSPLVDLAKLEMCMVGRDRDPDRMGIIKKAKELFWCRSGQIDIIRQTLALEFYNEWNDEDTRQMARLVFEGIK